MTNKNELPVYETFFTGPKNEVITHRFTNGVEVVVNLEEGKLRLFSGGKCKNTCNIKDYTVAEYESYLHGVAENANNI